MRKYIQILLFLVFFTYEIPAQYQNPSSLRWMQIRTPHFRVVFPEGIHDRGAETAYLLETAYSPVSKSLHSSPRPIPVFLFNQSITSNGYTALGPRHMGFYTTPSQNAGMVGGTDWLQILTIHEFRHAVQLSKLDQNITTIFGSIFGDYGKLFCMGVSVPFWVLEGDAVCAETVFSGEGRGRLASFTRDIRAMELENKRYSYSKAYLGSYKHYYPNHYHLGYLLTAYIRKNYGADVWDKAIEHTTKFPIYPFMFSRGLKKYTSNSLERTYQSCMNEFDSIWSANLTANYSFDLDKISPDITKGFTNYSYPFYCDTNRILSLKTGFDDAPTLVTIENGEETELIEINPVDRIHSNGTLVTWSSRVADIRWGQRDYAEILIYNLTTGELRYLTRKGKFFAPAISPDGTMIAAIEYGADMNCHLVLLDSKTGHELLRYTFATNEFARTPSWSAGSDQVVLPISQGQQRIVSIFDIDHRKWYDIISPTTESISNPVFIGDYIVFNSPITGTDAIHAIHIESKERFLIVQGKYGVYNVSLSSDGSYLIMQNYTTSGNEIAEQVVNIREWKKLPTVETKTDNYYMHLVNQEEGRNIFETIDSANLIGFKEKQYHPFFHSIKVHSWRPLPITNGIDFKVFSNDFLNTTILEAGINYYPNDFAHREYVNLKYAKFFPVFDLGFSYGRNYDPGKDSTDQYTYTEVNEKVFHFGISLPFDFSQHIYTTTLSPQIGFNYISAEFPEADSTQISEYDVSALAMHFTFLRSKQLSFRDIHPKFAQEFTVSYWNTPFGQDLKGSRLVASGRLYLPGIRNHHSLIISAGFEDNSPMFRNGIYQLTSSLEFVRGYGRVSSDRIRKGMIEYTIPLFYPDLVLGPVLYIKRISTNLFYDHALIYLENEADLYNSAGIDLSFEVNWFKVLVPFEMGVRYSYALRDHTHHFEFLIFGVSF